jgi:hypothetical protein
MTLEQKRQEELMSERGEKVFMELKKRGLNRRGQNITIGTLILILLGVIVLVFLIIGSITGFDFFFGKFSLLPGQSLQTIAQSCGLAKENNLKLDYCEYKKTKIDGDTQYINCQDSRIASTLDDFDGKIECDKNVYGELDYCKSKDLKADEIVNGLTCSQREDSSTVSEPSVK